MQILKVFWCQKIMGRIIQISLKQENTLKMLFTVIVKSKYVLMINLVNLLSGTLVKMLFAIFLIVWSRNAHTVVM